MEPDGPLLDEDLFWVLGFGVTEAQVARMADCVREGYLNWVWFPSARPFTPEPPSATVH